VSTTRSSFAVLESKLHPPAARREWVNRDDLITTLIESADKKVVFVEAPVGYGKTVLLAQWQQALTEVRPFAWVTLDPADNDPVQLWTYILEALARVDPHLGDPIMQLLTDQPDHLMEVIVPRLAADLAVLPQKLVICLDDYHHIRDEVCHKSIDMFIETLPQTTQIVIATRSDPALRLRRIGNPTQFTEIRTSRLRFDHDEAARLMDAALGRELADDEIDLLVERTEGWPAGMYLAALSLKDRADPKGFIEAFAGDNRLVVDYLTVEVLNKQSPALRRFLLRTSIMDRFTAAACDAVVGTRGSDAILKELERSNLYLSPINGRRRGYRDHRLFQDLLRSELQRTEPDLIPELNRRAAAWHRSWGFLAEAVAHATAAGDIPAVRDLIGSIWLAYWEAGRVEEVHSWLNNLGRDRVASDPVLALVAAWIAGLSGRSDELEEWIVQTSRGSFDGPLPDGTKSLESGLALIRALLGFRGVGASLEAARRAVELEGPDGRWRGKALSRLGYYLYLSGDFRGARAPLMEVAGSSGATSTDVLFAQAYLSMIAREEERGSEATHLASAARESIDKRDLTDDPSSAPAFLAMGLVFADQGNVPRATAELERALALARRSPWLQPWSALEASLALARVLSEAGDVEGASALLADAQAMLHRYPDGGILGDWAKQVEGRSADGGVLSAPLTEREMAVLKHLPSSFTQRAIGTQLHLSINTVKSHTRSIFKKLDVESRAQAVRKARELGLI
jgi:LuxR family maltose regulon positive regulatory protein